MKNKVAQPSDKLLPRLTVWLFGRPKSVFLVWVVLLVFGATSYVSLLRREGFPSIDIPIAVVNGTYIVNDPSKVDTEIAKPLSEIALKQANVSSVSSQSAANFFNVTVLYDASANGKEATEALKKAVEEAGVLPGSVQINYTAPYFGATGPSTEKIDAAVSIYQTDNKADASALVAKANEVVTRLNQQKPALVQNFFLVDPFRQVQNPITGEQQQIQRTFDRYGERDGEASKFYNSVLIGVTAVDDVDVIKLDQQLEDAFSGLKNDPVLAGYDASISASFAPSIEDSISELQKVLLEGLIAVLLVGSIVIAVRASLITVLSMITVISITLGLLYVIGYTLNVITLFALILGLSLIVDDTIIMVEAIDAARRKTKKPREAVQMAVRKISRAMVAATTTAALSFLPLAVIGGVLGTFIRAIPITIISALFISLIVALVFIPLFSKLLLLMPKQMGKKTQNSAGFRFEQTVAHAMTRPMQWARGSMKKLWLVGVSAVLIGVSFIIAAGALFSQVTFNLFPSSKDANQLSVTMVFPEGTDITKAQEIVSDANEIVAKELGDNFELASYYGAAEAQTATLTIDIKPYTARDITSKQLIETLQSALATQLKDTVVTVAQIDAGPPAAVFNTQVKTENRQAGYKLANDVANYMRQAELTRPNNTTARFTNVTVSTASSIYRADADQVIQISSGFNGEDTTTLVTLAQTALKEEFDAEKLKTYGLEQDALGFDLGQEGDNQDSFKSLLIAFPVILLVIYVLLVIEFRSLLQPLLIFLAIPFSLFGIVAGLFLTDNPFSFFCAMGFFALIGLSIKNTILVVDYANQARRAGAGAIDAAVAALEERFRPLIATSLTAVVSLIPLALTSPFWQGLAVVLIGGLLSSTLLVVTVFPYYYLGAEYLRARISAKQALAFLAVFAATAALLFQAFGMPALLVGLVAAVSFSVLTNRFQKRTV